MLPTLRVTEDVMAVAASLCKDMVLVQGDEDAASAGTGLGAVDGLDGVD